MTTIRGRLRAVPRLARPLFQLVGPPRSLAGRLLFALLLMAHAVPAFAQSAVTGGTGSSDCVIGCGNAPVSAPDVSKIGSSNGTAPVPAPMASTITSADPTADKAALSPIAEMLGYVVSPFLLAGRPACRQDRGACDARRDDHGARPRRSCACRAWRRCGRSPGSTSGSCAARRSFCSSSSSMTRCRRLGIKLDTFTTAVLGFALNEAAFSAEIIRGGILSVNRNQSDRRDRVRHGPVSDVAADHSCRRQCARSCPAWRTT